MIAYNDNPQNQLKKKKKASRHLTIVCVCFKYLFLERLIRKPRISQFLPNMILPNPLILTDSWSIIKNHTNL